MTIPHITRLLSVLLTLAGIFILWQLACLILNVPDYILPTPLQIFSRMVQEWDVLLHHARYTLLEVLLGFVMSILVGVPLAIIIVYSKYFSTSFYPIIIGIQCVPIVCFAPLLVVWFGFGLVTKILIAFLISLFPIIVNSAVGLKSMEKEMFNLAKSLRANRLQLFWYFRLPKALPHIFGGFKIGMALAVVGAVVAEFVASDRGLGYLQLAANSRLDTTFVFTIIFTLAIIGIGMYNLVGLIERLSMPWYRASRGEE